MSASTCPHCGAPRPETPATNCASCGQPFPVDPAAPRSAHADALAEVARRAKAESWAAHVPENHFVERHHGALRVGLGLAAFAGIVLLPTAGFALFGAVKQAERDRVMQAAFLVGLGTLAAMVAVAALMIAWRALRSFRAYGRAPVEHCPAVVVGKRRETIGKAGRELNAVTLEFANGERREYRSSRLTFDAAVEQRAGLAFLRANHLLHLQQLPG